MKIGITSQSTLCFSIERIVGGSGDCGDVDKAMWERSPVLLDIPVIQIMKKISHTNVSEKVSLIRTCYLMLLGQALQCSYLVTTLACLFLNLYITGTWKDLLDKHSAIYQKKKKKRGKLSSYLINYG